MNIVLHFLLILDKAFLFLASNIAEPAILNATNTSLTIALPPAKTNRTWKGLAGPTATYLVYYAALDDGTNSSYLEYKILVRLKLVIFVFVTRCLLSLQNLSHMF